VNTGARKSDIIDAIVENCTSPLDNRVHTIALPAVVGAASIIANPVLVPPERNGSMMCIPNTGTIPYDRIKNSINNFQYEPIGDDFAAVSRNEL
jgi:hypothetical protein